jgi:hypothetical protein
MYTLFNMSPGPPVGAPLSVRAPLEPIKGRARTLEHKFYTETQKFTLTHTKVHTLQAIHHTMDVVVLRSGGPNHSKPVCATHVHTPLDRAFLDYPQTHPKLGLGGCTLPPGWRNPPTLINQNICSISLIFAQQLVFTETTKCT